ncbi:hypothetical protein ESCOMMO228B1_09930 [Escherichia coli]
MPDAALTPYPAYKVRRFNILQVLRRPDKRSASGYFAFVISRRHPDSIGVTDNHLLDPFTTQVIFVITAKVDHAFRGDFQNAGRQGAYELTVV